MLSLVAVQTDETVRNPESEQICLGFDIAKIILTGEIEKVTFEFAFTRAIEQDELKLSS